MVGSQVERWYLTGEVEDVVFCKDWGRGKEVVENVHFHDLICVDG